MSSIDWQKIVLQFTKKAEFDVPDRPVPLNKLQLEHIVNMVLDELTELRKAANENVTEQAILKQSDAFIDIIYYILDCANRQGWNLQKLFKLVHLANMNKIVDSVNKSESGKILKPVNWQSPDEDMLKIIKQQIREGSW